MLRAGATAAGVLSLGAGAASATGRSRAQRRFFAVMRPENAVPPTEPLDQEGARGLGVFFLDREEQNVFWKILVDDTEGITGVHVHRGGADENGPHLVDLFNVAEPTGEVDGVLDRGVFGEGDACTADDFPVANDCITQPGQPAGPPAEEGELTFEDVVGEMRDGNTYLQLHGDPGSRVMRGQIR